MASCGVTTFDKLRQCNGTRDVTESHKYIPVDTAVRGELQDQSVARLSAVVYSTGERQLPGIAM